MSKICLIGTEGAGKTVFLTVLAHRYQNSFANGVWLEYQNPRTAKFVSTNWDTLTVKRDWPPSTPTGTFGALKWVFHTPDGASHPLSVIDSPGQDIRAIFTADEDEFLDENLSALKQELESADVVLFLLNLQEAIRATTAMELDACQVPVVSFLQWAQAKRKRFALLLSQSDQIMDWLKVQGISGNFVQNALERCLPMVHAILFRNEINLDFCITFVAAVAETEYAAGSKLSLRPKANFSSRGLEKVVECIFPNIFPNIPEKEEQEGVTPKKEEQDGLTRRDVIISIIILCISLFITGIIIISNS
ncbi:hypothetical protein [Candidatus Spyradosoma sp. SGI.093]|uniref:hypothetical protein n=1 Tax=Candidatus Spyradosoma sp. SGI.093 TaxID=3420583 RepID=UPI003D0686C6